MQKKFVLTTLGITIVLLVGLISVLLVYRNKQAAQPATSPALPAVTSSAAEVTTTTATTSVSGSQLYDQAHNPLKGSVPQTNPFKTKTNPFTATKTNPLKGIYTNPF